MNPSAPDTAVPAWIRIVLGFELAITALFFAWSWSHTVGMAQGRPASLQDIAGLSIPLVLVILFGAATIVLCRRGRRDWAGLCAVAPWPAALVLFSLLGAI
jgi:hypothetical protein